ncbi:MAG: glycosyltransferase [Anaerolineaceae bacterium]|nr:glycosyltransferase [Anaerolineaceae bacterium]
MLGTPYDLRIVANKMLLLAVILIGIILFSFLVRKNRKLIKYFIGFAILLQFIYIGWRIAFTIPGHLILGFFFGSLLFLAEFMGLIQSTTHRLMFLKEFVPLEKSLADLDELPTVDILIATYNEPVSILRNTVAAATGQNYPKDKFQVFLCDDGSREEVQQLAKEYGAVWSTRGEHVHAKAGNINNCLREFAHGELFLVLDADMITKSNFLERTVGYFSDPNMALVQAPQVFYNPDPFQNNLLLYDDIPNEQDFFMREVLNHRAMFNAVLNVGTNALFRRSAIDDIGLIPVGSITEDMATSMLLQGKGYQTTFVNETLAMGLSPNSFSDYIIQRDRWCRGNIQVLKKWNPWKLPGLSFMQRLIYFDGVLYWFFGLQKIMYTIGPILFLLFGVPIYYSDVFTMLLFFAPMYFSSSAIFTLFNHKSRTYTWAHIYETALAPYLAISAISELFFSKGTIFKVTPKDMNASKTRFAFKVAFPQLVLAFLCLLALGFGIHKLLTDVNYMIPVYLVNLFWLLYNLLGIITAILVSFENPRHRAVERFEITDQLKLQLSNGKTLPVQVLDISTIACAVEPLIDIEEPDDFVGSPIKLFFTNEGFSIDGTFFRSRGWGKRIILNFENMDKDQYTGLVKYIFNRQQDGFGTFAKEKPIHKIKGTASKAWKILFPKR